MWLVGLPRWLKGKKLLGKQEPRVQSLGWEDPLKKERVAHSSIFACKVPWTRGVWWATVCGVTLSQT